MKTQDRVKSIVEDITQVRFTPYRNAYGSDIFGLRGYRYNIILGQAIWEASAVFEIILRNRIVRSWNSWYFAKGLATNLNDWPMKIHSLHGQIALLKHKTPLNKKAFQSLEDQEKKAYGRAVREIKTRTITNGDVVARLMFGFWHECLSSHFRVINASQIKDVFPNYPYQYSNIERDIADIATDLQSIKDFRNRLAHHEKIDVTIAKRKYLLICEYITYINPEALKIVSVDGFNKISNYSPIKVTRNFPYF